jgi:CheY-like chemotaxis protein
LIPARNQAFDIKSLGFVTSVHVRFTAPLCPCSVPPVRSIHRQTDDKGGRSITEKRNILYVEDDETNILLMEEVLGAHPVNLSCVSGAEAALELASKVHPDLIFLDLKLIDCDGYEILDQLRADLTTKDIPVVALTAAAMPFDIERGLKAGFDGYITKPFNVCTIVDVAFSNPNVFGGPTGIRCPGPVPNLPAVYPALPR